jgi:hypothetical protein
VSAVPFASLTVRMGAACVYTSTGGNGDVTILRRPMRRMKAPQRRGVTLIVAVKPSARFRGEAAEDEKLQYEYKDSKVHRVKKLVYLPFY